MRGRAVMATGSDPARRDRFRAAAAHSRLVRFLRLAIPVGTVIAITALSVFLYLDPFRVEPVSIDIGSLALDGSKITMDQANLRGFKDGDQPFTITARRAVQDISTPYIVDLTGLNAELTLPDLTAARITADTGVYDSQKDVLTVNGHVAIVSLRYDIRLQSGTIDFKTNRVVTKQPVTVKMAGGSVDADMMNVFDNGDRVVFAGHVRSVFSSRHGPAGGPDTTGD